MTQRFLLANRLITPDGTILESFNRHDYKGHNDTVTGEYYFTDGGLEYIRRSVNKVPGVDDSVYSDDPHWGIREYFRWGTRGVDGTEPLHYVKLKDLTKDHIEAILRTQTHVPDYIQKVLRDELKYRYQTAFNQMQN